MSARLWGVAAFLAAMTAGTAAQAGPLIAAAAIWITTALPFISVVVDTIIFYGVQAALYAGLGYVLTKLTTPKLATAGQERQASVTTLTLGETACELLYGEAAMAGALADCFNWGGTNGTDWEVLVINLADHKCEALVGYYIGDVYYEWAGGGAQTGFSGQLEIYWHDGALDQAADSYLVANGPGWTSDDRMAGRAYAVVAYKADAPNATNPIWSTGRPSFLWRIKGRKVYDPRLDPTVDGGDPAGTHSATDPTTWEWSDNPILCRYDYVRGVYAGDQIDEPSQLLFGRGLSTLEAPPARVIAYANICDELVALKAGGTEKRYRVGGVIQSNETFEKVDELFAAATAGVIAQREGGVEVEPGHAKSVVLTLTDGDLATGFPCHVEGFLGENDRVNMVTPRYIEPAQIWRDTAAPVRRSLDDMVSDGGQKVAALTMSMVTSQTQAQRCGEITRRLGRRERRASIVLPPRFAALEEGDWIAWTSDRRFHGDTITFRVEAQSEDQGLRKSLALREISASCYDWDAATDEGVPGQAPVEEPGSLSALELSGVSITAIALSGGGSTSVPAVRAEWDVPVDLAIKAVRLEIRRTGEVEISPTTTQDPNHGAMITTSGVALGSAMQGRLIPLGVDGRRTTPTAWVDITTSDLTIDLSSILWALSTKNLWAENAFIPDGATSKVDPMTLGQALWGLTIPGGSTSNGAHVTPHIQGLLADGAIYSFSFKAKVDTGTATIRCGWRDSGGGAISDVPDKSFALTSTLSRFTWDGVSSSDPDFVNARFYIFQNSGDVPSGRTVSMTDLMIVGGQISPYDWLPPPDAKDLLRYAGYLGDLAATKNTVSSGASAPASPTDGDIWVDTSTTPYVVKMRVAGSWQVSAANGGVFGSSLYRTTGGTIATLSDFLTSLGTAAAITGQAAWATYGSKDPNYVLQLLDASTGRLTSVFGSPANAPSGAGWIMTSWPFTSTSSSISVVAFTLKGYGVTLSFPSGTMSGIESGRSFKIFAAWLAGTIYYTAVKPEYVADYQNTDYWLLLGEVLTKDGYGAYVSPTPPAEAGGLDGGGGLGGSNYAYIQP